MRPKTDKRHKDQAAYERYLKRNGIDPETLNERTEWTAEELKLWALDYLAGTPFFTLGRLCQRRSLQAVEQMAWDLGYGYPPYNTLFPRELSLVRKGRPATERDQRIVRAWIKAQRVFDRTLEKKLKRSAEDTHRFANWTPPDMKYLASVLGRSVLEAYKLVAESR